MQKMDAQTGELLDLGQSLEEVDLRLGIKRVDEKIHDCDFVVHDSTHHGRLVFGVKQERFGAVLADGSCLGVGSHKSEQLVVGREVGRLPAGQKRTSEVSGGTGDEDVMRGHVEGSGQ